MERRQGALCSRNTASASSRRKRETSRAENSHTFHGGAARNLGLESCPARRGHTRHRVLATAAPRSVPLTRPARAAQAADSTLAERAGGAWICLPSLK